jgi:hypothetical protein
MDLINILLVAVVVLSAAALAGMSAYEYGFRHGRAQTMELANRRVQGALAELAKSRKRLNLPKRKPKAVKA